MISCSPLGDRRAEARWRGMRLERSEVDARGVRPPCGGRSSFAERKVTTFKVAAEMNGPQGRTLREENSRTALTALAEPQEDTDSSSSSSSTCSNDANSKGPQYFAALLGMRQFFAFNKCRLHNF